MNRCVFLVLAGLLLLPGPKLWADGDWNQLDPTGAPSARFGHSMVPLADGRILLFGGEGAEGLSDDLSVFDNGNWNSVTPSNTPPAPRRDHKAWVRGEQMYVWGGFGENQQVFNDLWKYDVQTNAWNEVATGGTRPPARYGHTSTTLADGSMLIFGGTGADGVARRDLWRLNTDGSWTELVSAAYRYSHHNAQLVDGYLYIFGIPDFLSYYEVSTGIWDYYNLDLPLGSFGSTATGLNDLGETIVYIYGGYDANGAESSAVYEFNSNTGEYTIRPSPMPMPLVHAAAAPLPDSRQSAAPHSTIPMPNGILNCTPVGSDVVGNSTNVQMLFFGGKSNGQIVNTTLGFYSQGAPPPPPPPPPPAGGDILSQIGALGHGRFAMFVVRYPQKQGEVKVNIEWANDKSKLCLLGLSLPGDDIDAFGDEDELLRYSMRNIDKFSVVECHKRKHWRKGRRHQLDEKTQIEKKFTDAKLLVLLVKHHPWSQTAKEIQVKIAKSEDNADNVLYAFPIGTFPPQPQERVHFMRLPSEPVRWVSHYPHGAQVEEKTQTAQGYWEWQATDRTRRGCFGFFRLAFVKFELP